MLKEEYLNFEKLNLSHVLKMRNWGRHSSPLFQDYNFEFNSEGECKAFLAEKTLSPLNSYYAIIYLEEVIGFIGNKNYNPFTKSTTLGLVLNPSLVGRGYGSLALRKFLRFYFYEKNMRKMDLLVAAYNDKALRLYEKMGFRKKSSHLEKYPNLYINRSSDEYLDHKEAFVDKKNTLYNYVYKMELRKEDFIDDISS